MTELYIDGQLVTLPEDVKFSFIEQNPFLTKKGKYTFEIKLSLLNKNNARIYGHMHRKNCIIQDTQKRSAVLIVDSHVVLNGTGIILEKTNTEVSLQLVSGNSELNYISGSDLKIRSLSLGYDQMYNAFPVDIENWLIGQMDDNLSPHLAIPFVNTENEYIGNLWQYYVKIIDNVTYFKLRYAYNSRQNWKDPNGDIVHYANIRPQPKIWWLVELILTHLGYTVSGNAIKIDPKLQKLYMVHGYNVDDWSKMLPDWTVSEFFTNIELFTHCTVLVDNITKVASIVSNNDNNKVVNIEVEDDYSDELKSENSVETYLDKNIGYSLDSEADYYKYAQVKKSVTDYAQIVDLRGGSMTTQERLSSLLFFVNDTSDTERFNKIFRTDFGDFIAYNDGSKVIAKEINYLKPVYNNPEESTNLDLELKIIPAKMTVKKMIAYKDELVNTELDSFEWYFQVPIVEHADDFSTSIDITPKKIQGLINGTESANEEYLSDKMYVAIFSGRQPVDGFFAGGNYIRLNNFENFPTAYIRSLAEYFDHAETRRLFSPEPDKPLSPQSMYDNYYSSGLKIDLDQKHTFTFIRPVTFSATNIFMISGRKYLCERIESDVDGKGFSKLSKGIFYPVIQ